ncbi:MAG: DUF1993 domain-containing protein [Pseudomonadota bacterium]
MALSISSTVLATVDHTFQALDGVLEKGAERCKMTDVAESVYLNWQLAPDMFPLAAQVRFASEIPARGLSRLAGADIPSFEDNETSFAELRARIKKSREIIEGLDQAALDAKPEADIAVPMGPQSVTLPRQAFAHHWILPNLYFHVTGAYLILRHLGVDIGKRDFLIGLKEYFE